MTSLHHLSMIHFVIEEAPLFMLVKECMHQNLLMNPWVVWFFMIKRRLWILLMMKMKRMIIM